MASIFKRPGSKTYSVIYDVTDDEGKRKQAWESGLSYTQAKTRKREIEEQKEKGTFARPNELTVAKYLEQWLEYYRKKGNAFSTCNMVENVLTNRVIPVLGAKKLQELTSKEVEEFFLELKKSQHIRSDYKYILWEEEDIPKISQNTIRHVFIYLNMALNKAVEWNLLSLNPITIDAPPKKDNHRPAWDEETLLEALGEIKDPLLHLCLHLAFIGSMRAGEIAGITWDCVDFEDESIHIDKIVQRVKKTDLENTACEKPIMIFPNAITTRPKEEIKSCLVLKPPKTIKSNRVIYMTEPLKQELIKRKQLVGRRKVVLDKEYNDYNLVICLEDGKPIEPKLIAKWFKKFIKRHGGAFPDVTLHSLRSTSTTYKLVVSKGDIKSVQGDTGHATAKMVMDDYAKIQDKSRKKMAKAIEKNFYGNRQEASPKPEEVIIPAPKNDVEEYNNMWLLQKLAENPEAMQALLGALQKKA